MKTPQVLKRVEKSRGMSRREDHGRRLRQFNNNMLSYVIKARQAIPLQSQSDLGGDPFAENSKYGQYALLPPPYDPSRLYMISEESAILPKCIDAMVCNVPGFGSYELLWQGPGEEPEEDPGKTEILDILRQVNADQSYLTMRRELRRDYETTGNAYIEVLRYPQDQSIAMLFRAKAAYIRITAPGEAIDIPVMLPRKGKMVKTMLKKRFRRFAYLASGQRNLRWFKEFGDPRKMSWETGEYVQSTKFPATELIHFKNESGISSYGLPRWIGCILGVLGASSAEYVNYDLFQNQGIPPVAVTVSGGQLTSESIEELENMFMEFKGKSNFNKVAILEAEDLSGDLDSPNKAKIDIKSLIDYRKDDAMFQKYIESTNMFGRQAFRLPPLYIGVSESYTFASAKTSRLIAEEQIFLPERQREDEQMSLTVFGNIPQWKIMTKGPEIIRSDEIATMFSHMANAGALTINSAIDVANRIFDLDLEKRTEEWGDLPLLMLNGLMKLGRLAVPDGVLNDESLITQGQPEPKLLEAPSPRATSPTEKELGELKDVMEKFKAIAPHLMLSTLPQ